MVQIDWNKVAENYQNSSFNQAGLYQYAQKAAEALKGKDIPFDGYTDQDWHEPPKRQLDMGIMARLRRFAFPDPQPPDTCAPLARCHIGYWVLETSEEESHFGHRGSEFYVTKNGYFKEKKNIVFAGHAIIRKTKWVLLEEGSLAVYVTKQQYSEYPPIEKSWLLKEIGSAALSAETVHNKEITDEWRSMTDEDILLLDHKKRDVRSRWVRRDEYSVEDSKCIRMNNYLLTGKKGGGCSKKITTLLKKYGL